MEVEKATFRSFIFACKGDTGLSGSKAIQRLASRISDNKDSHSDVITYIRTKICVALMPCSLLCLRGARLRRRRSSVEASGTIVGERRLLSSPKCFFIFFS